MKKSFIAAVFLLAGVTAFAQERENRDADGNILRGPYETNKFSANWFFSLGGGINIYEGYNDGKVELKNRIAPAAEVSVGKWLTPWAGVRVQAAGFRAKGATSASAYAGEAISGTNLKVKEFNTLNVHADYLWNISNAIAGFNEKRVWNIIPYVGFGWAGNMLKDKAEVVENELAGFAGILNTFRLGKRVDLTLEARQMFVNPRFDGEGNHGKKFEGMSSVTMGLNFKLGKTTFDRVVKAEPADYSAYNDRINDLRAQNDRLREENKKLADELVAAKNRPVETKEAEVLAAPLALFFTIGKAELDSRQLTNLDLYANSVIKQTSKNFTITGSADKATGSAAYNQKLSERRADHVYNLLVNKYGISADRLTKKAEGDTNNRFKEPLLNRVVIIE